jgi:dimethylhistidine N-methyltransferase
MNQFVIDVEEGLSSNPKFLSSKYFYDERGDKLFQEIMELEEYYLTRSEFEILNKYKDQLLEYFAIGDESFHLIEFGAGDGLKTKVLLSHFLNGNTEFKYSPIDISKNALNSLMQDLGDTFPDLDSDPIHNDYFSALHELKKFSTRKVVMFLGSNIGNFRPDEAAVFMRNMNNELNTGDYVLIGIDLKKEPELILNAYNDSKGVTKEFNLNLLRRINRELDADFDIDAFDHTPSYDPDTGAAISHISSKRDQQVSIGHIGKEFEFSEGERVFTEISQKYSIGEIEDLARAGGFEILENFYDSKGFFVDTLWKVI